MFGNLSKRLASKYGYPTRARDPEAPYTLVAERECCRDRVYGGYASLEAAAAFVDKLEDRGDWPEGYDAVAVSATGKRHLYVGPGWEKG